MQFVLAPLDKVQLLGGQSSGVRSGKGARNSASALPGLTLMDEDKRAPGLGGHRHEPFVLLAEILDAVEFRRAAQMAGQVVGPAVIAAPQLASPCRTVR